jgi:hypothetical protein
MGVEEFAESKGIPLKRSGSTWRIGVTDGYPPER